MILMLETYLLPKVKKYEDAAAAVEAWQQSARGGEESSTEGLAIHYLAGLAALERGESLKPNDPARKASLAAARRHFEFVGRFPGDHQRDARTKLTSLSGNSEATEAEPTNYAEAKACAVERFARFHRGMLARGVYLPPSQFEAWFVGACHSDAEILRTLEAAQAALKAL